MNMETRLRFVTALAVAALGGFCWSGYGASGFAAETHAEVDNGHEGFYGYCGSADDASDSGHAVSHVEFYDPAWAWNSVFIEGFGQVAGQTVKARAGSLYGGAEAPGYGLGQATSLTRWSIDSASLAPGSQVYAKISVTFSGTLEAWSENNWSSDVLSHAYGSADVTGSFQARSIFGSPRIEGSANVFSFDGGIALAGTSGDWTQSAMQAITEGMSYSLNAEHVLWLPVKAGDVFETEIGLWTRAETMRGEGADWVPFPDFENPYGGEIYEPLMMPYLATASADFTQTGTFSIEGVSETLGGDLLSAITITQVPVPEPAECVAVMAFGLLGFAVWRRPPIT